MLASCKLACHALTQAPCPALTQASNHAAAVPGNHDIQETGSTAGARIADGVNGVQVVALPWLDGMGAADKVPHTTE